MAAKSMKPPNPRKVAWCNKHQIELTFKKVGEHNCLGKQCPFYLRYGEKVEAVR
jgi:hypothetical protein